MAQDWTENLTPDEARAAIDALNDRKAPLTAREVRLRRALQAKVDAGE